MKNDRIDNPHLCRPVWCNDCDFVGVTGDLIAGGHSPDLQCPKCRKSSIRYNVMPAPGLMQ
jgi:predicted Zn-ribbon and HTH transcriptional regulator